MSGLNRTLLGLLLLVVLSLRVQAQGLERAANAHGRGLVNGDIQDWTAEGRITYFTAQGTPKQTFDFTLIRKGNSQVQRVIRQGAHEVRQGTDGVSMWDSLDGQFVTAAQGSTRQFLESQTTRSVPALLNAAKEGLTVRDLGPKGVNTRSFEAEDRRGRKTQFDMDEDSGLISRQEFMYPLGADLRTGREVSTRDTFEFSDFRTVQGIATPFKVERFKDGIKVEEMRFTIHKYNASIKDSVFKP